MAAVVPSRSGFFRATLAAPMKSRLACAMAAAGLELTTLGATVHAAPELAWTAAPGCPDEPQVQAAFRRMSVHPSPRNVRARATIRREGPRYELELSLFSRSGTAEIHLVADECTTLADVVALELALAADAGAVTSAVKASRGNPEPRIGVALFVGGAVGPLPGFSPAIRAAVQLELAPVRIEVGGKYLFGQTKTYENLPEPIGGDFQATLGFARLCSAFPTTGFGVAACGGIESGVIRGDGFGPAESFESNQLWVSATAAPVLRYALASGLSFFGEGEFGIAVVRPEFHARGLPTLFSPDRTAAFFWIGVGQLF
jgi:hypothetical protein